MMGSIKLQTSTPKKKSHRYLDAPRNDLLTTFFLYASFFPKAAAKGSFKKSAVIKHCYQTLPKVLLK